MNKPAPNPQNELKVFIAIRESKCDECGEDMGHHPWITLEDNGRRALCLSCSDLDHLVYLPAGDAAVTRRARKYSKLSAVVLKWSRARKRYERQGLLVESEALDRAEQECEADADQREARRERAAERRAELDQAYVSRFAARVRELYPRCLAGREQTIAEHACRKYSGRVGRGASAKELDEDAVRLAVAAHVRHAETNYDELLLRNVPRREARAEVRGKVGDVLKNWQ
ncbi:MAG: DUF2293 domain-containing protein [Candidatus Sumerlaeota bacterium]|nr:DUF2293 domain-containing protein [Candidatus Sumerlaeota bacterium]